MKERATWEKFQHSFQWALMLGIWHGATSLGIAPRT